MKVMAYRRVPKVIKKESRKACIDLGTVKRKVMKNDLNDLFPLYGVEHDIILSMQGDMTIAYKAALPELFTLFGQECEAFHQALIKNDNAR